MGESTFTKLNDENYDTWAFEMYAKLKRKGVLTIVEGTEGCPPESDTYKVVRAWVSRRDLATMAVLQRSSGGWSWASFLMWLDMRMNLMRCG